MANSRTGNLILVLTGPTGIGKTFVSTLIAEELPLEIISADSRQVYKYLDIGTAKPSREIRDKIRHHFIDILEPNQYFSAGEFGEQARKVIDEIFSRNKVPLVVGGSGLYLKSLLEGFFGEDFHDLKIRSTLEHRLKKEGPKSLYRDLQKMDAPIARRIHPNNTRRILRAIEVCLVSGRRLSDLQKIKTHSPHFRSLKLGLTRKRSELYSHINARVEGMFEAGLIAEATHILEMGFERNLNSLNTVGYKEVFDYLEGSIAYRECVELVKRNSRRYAKRQYTWFNADREIKWLLLDEQNNFSQVAEKIIEKYHREEEETF